MHAVYRRRRVDLGRRHADRLGHVVRDDGRDREDDQLAPHLLRVRVRVRVAGSGEGSGAGEGEGEGEGEREG